MSHQRRPAFFWFVVLLSAVYLAFLAFTIHAIVSHYGVVKDSGWTLRVAGGGWFVSAVEADGPAAGQVEIGDRLLAFKGDERAAVIGASQFRNVSGDEIYRVDVERRGQRVSLQLPLRVVFGRKLDFLMALVGVAFFVCGAALALLRPRDAQTRLIGVLMIFVAFVALIASLSQPRPFLVGWQRVLYFVLTMGMGTWTSPMTYHVFNRFPDWKPAGLGRRVIQWLLYGVAAIVIWPMGIVSDLGLDVFDSATQFLAEHPRLYLTSARISGSSGRGGFLFMVVCLVLALVASARNYRRLDSEDSRRRIRWVLAGLSVALVPFIVLTFASRVTDWISDATYRSYMPITFLAMLCIPASIVMAVWQEQLFDIRVLVRRGLQYLFARAALRTLIALPVVVLAFSIFSNPDRTIGQILTKGAGWINIGLIGAIAVALQSRQRLQVSLDRRFFREAYEQEQVLVHLIDEVRQRDSSAEVATLVSARVDSVLHPSSLHIFYRAHERSDHFDGQSSSGVVTGAQLSGQQTLLRLLDGDKTIRDVPAGVEGALPADERAWLETLGVRVIVPIAGTRDRLVGVLLLGERKSEEPYSATDRRLLQSIAAQIGLVYENQHLQERVRRDADVRRDVLSRLDDRDVTLMKECPLCGRCFDGASERCDTDGAELALTMPIERTLDGKYRLERALGRGGFGAVYEAADLRLQRQVAAKIMMGSLFGDQTAGPGGGSSSARGSSLPRAQPSGSGSCSTACSSRTRRASSTAT